MFVSLLCSAALVSVYCVLSIAFMSNSQTLMISGCVCVVYVVNAMCSAVS